MQNLPTAQELENSGLLARPDMATAINKSVDSVRRIIKTHNLPTTTSADGRIFVHPDEFNRLGYKVTLPTDLPETSGAVIVELERARTTINKHVATIGENNETILKLTADHAQVSGQLATMSIALDTLRDQLQENKKQLSAKDQQLARYADWLSQWVRHQGGAA